MLICHCTSGREIKLLQYECLGLNVGARRAQRLVLNIAVEGQVSGQGTRCGNVHRPSASGDMRRKIVQRRQAFANASTSRGTYLLRDTDATGLERGPARTFSVCIGIPVWAQDATAFWTSQSLRRAPTASSRLSSAASTEAATGASCRHSHPPRTSSRSQSQAQAAPAQWQPFELQNLLKSQSANCRGRIADGPQPAACEPSAQFV